MEANPAMDQQKSQQTKQAALDSARISALVRSGAMKSSDLPRLKIALRRQSEVGDIARLPKQHRDVLTRYYDATSSAAIGSQQAFQAVRKNLMQHNEIEGDELITEAIAGFKDEQNPPVMIVLQRKGIRIFPDGKKVAMYHNKQLGLVITIPYAGTGNSPGEVIPGTNIQMEEVEPVNELKDETLKSYLEKRPSPKIRDIARKETVGKPEERQKDIERANLTRIGRARAKAKLLKRNPPPRKQPEYDPTDRGYGQGRYMGDSVEVSGDVMESLEQVAAYAQQDNVTSHAKHMKFADGSKLKVSHGAAKAIHMVHGALNDENKKKFADMLTTPKGFEKAAHFALSKVNFTINK